MKLRNTIQLIGNVGNDPEVKNLDLGKKVASFSLATNETYKNEAGEKITNTEWHRLVAWNKTADIVESFVTKGKEIAIEGKLTYSNYEDNEGVKRTSAEIQVRELVLLGSKD